jgi:hypothetical protein
MRNKSGKAALLVAVLALLSSLAGFSPAAGFIITSSKQIKPGVVLSSDIHKNGVRDSDIAGNAVTGSDVSPSAIGTTDIAEGGVTTGDIGADQVTATDIGANQVTPESVEAPEPEEEILTGGTVEATSEFAPTPLVGHYTKEDPTSILSVEWNGSAHAAFSGCVFQLRVNGQAPSPGLEHLVRQHVSAVRRARHRHGGGRSLGEGDHRGEHLPLHGRPRRHHPPGARNQRDHRLAAASPAASPGGRFRRPPFCRSPESVIPGA